MSAINNPARVEAHGAAWGVWSDRHCWGYFTDERDAAVFAEDVRTGQAFFSEAAARLIPPSKDPWGGTPDLETQWLAGTEANLGALTPSPHLSLRDLALDAVMATTIDELNQVVQAAAERFGEAAFDLSCVVPSSMNVVPFGTLIARCAGAITDGPVDVLAQDLAADEAAGL